MLDTKAHTTLKIAGPQGSVTTVSGRPSLWSASLSGPREASEGHQENQEASEGHQENQEASEGHPGDQPGLAGDKSIGELCIDALGAVPKAQLSVSELMAARREVISQSKHR